MRRPVDKGTTNRNNSGFKPTRESSYYNRNSPSIPKNKFAPAKKVVKPAEQSEKEDSETESETENTDKTEQGEN